jgi:hypothetical protein
MASTEGKTMNLPTRHRYEVLPLNPTERQDTAPPLLPRRWKVTKDGVRVHIARLKVEAVRTAVTIAKAGLAARGELSTLKIKGRNGRIQDERTYGKDPIITKG